MVGHSIKKNRIKNSKVYNKKTISPSNLLEILTYLAHEPSMADRSVLDLFEDCSVPLV